MSQKNGLTTKENQDGKEIKMYIKPEFENIKKQSFNKDGKTEPLRCVDCREEKDNYVNIQDNLGLCADCWWRREYPEHNFNDK